MVTETASPRVAETALGPLPFALIAGAVYPGDPSWTGPEGRRKAHNYWVWKIGREVESRYQTKAERDAAAEFVLRHRLSIANAFERKIIRADVVKALGE